MADTRGDDLAPVIQEILRKTYLQQSKRIAKQTANQQKESIQSLNQDQTVIMIGQKGKDGKPEFNTIVETDKNGQVIVQKVNEQGNLEDVSKQYSTIIEAQKQAIQSPNSIQDDLVPNPKDEQKLDGLNSRVYANANVQTNGELDKRVEQSIQANRAPETAINDVLGNQKEKVSFREFNNQLKAKGLEARLTKTGEDLNGFPKVKVQIYNPDNPADSINWEKFKGATINNIKEKVDLSQQYQAQFNTEIVLAQRTDLKKKLETSELTTNKIVMTRDGERVNFSFEDSKGNKEVIEQLNKLPNNEAVQIAQQYNENISTSGKEIKPNAAAYDQKIAKAIPLPKVQRNEQRLKIS